MLDELKASFKDLVEGKIDVPEFLNEYYLDFKVVLSSRKDIEEICLLAMTGNPVEWHCISDTGKLRIEHYEFGRPTVIHEYHDLLFKEVFEILAEYLEETWLPV